MDIKAYWSIMFFNGQIIESLFVGLLFNLSAWDESKMEICTSNVPAWKIVCIDFLCVI